MIAILDYGVGNIGSILNMFRWISVDAELVSSPDAVESADKLLLPGVGSFDDGMRRLNAAGLAEPLLQRAVSGAPVLGICLGMQMLTDGSEEGEEQGLGLIPGRCRRFRFDGPDRLKVPHMGWNPIRVERSTPLTDALPDEPRFYFVHSYHVECDDAENVIATADYGGPFAAMIGRGNVMGAQFHPEKSHRFGAALLKAFAGA